VSAKPNTKYVHNKTSVVTATASRALLLVKKSVVRSLSSLLQLSMVASDWHPRRGRCRLNIDAIEGPDRLTARVDYCTATQVERLDKVSAWFSSTPRGRGARTRPRRFDKEDSLPLAVYARLPLLLAFIGIEPYLNLLAHRALDAPALIGSGGRDPNGGGRGGGRGGGDGLVDDLGGGGALVKLGRDGRGLALEARLGGGRVRLLGGGGGGGGRGGVGGDGDVDVAGEGADGESR